MVAQVRNYAPAMRGGQRARPKLCNVPRVAFNLRRLDTGGLVHRYPTEGAALAFIRDVVRIGGHDQAACFVLDEEDASGDAHRIADGVDLVKRALQDKSL